MWLDRVKSLYGDDLELNWKNYSLEQNNFSLQQKSDGTESDWKVWEDDEIGERRSLMSQVAAEAARRQGPELFDKFHLALLTARHGGEGRIALNEEEPLVELAQQVGLDVARFREDLRDPELRKVIGSQHEEAVEQGIFGTPTFVFENGNAAFIKAFIPPQDDAMAEWGHFVAIASKRSYIGEIKRPQPPWPKGAMG